jgi:DNA-binding response OmpR family regulator
MAAKTVLVVDDEESDRVLICRILERENYTVLEADTYQAALSVFEKNRDSIALLLTDISLPGGNGCDLWVSMRKRKSELQVLFVSGHVGAEVLRFYVAEPAIRHFLGKPLKSADLLAKVAQVLGSTEFPQLKAEATER